MSESGGELKDDGVEENGMDAQYVDGNGNDGIMNEQAISMEGLNKAYNSRSRVHDQDDEQASALQAPNNNDNGSQNIAKHLSL